MKLKIKVSTGKQKFCIKRKENILLVDVKSNPENGKANLEIIKEFEKKFKNKTRIVRGHTNKSKIIEIDCLESDFDKLLLK